MLPCVVCDDPFQLKLIHSVRGIGYRFDTQP
jgi:two-component system copper resistance phosphate regulon response regulator CusR